jgi:DNA polymerase (family 10)
MSMAADNATIADRLDEIADLLDLQDANPFRVRAYRNAARTVRRYGTSMVELVEQGKDLDDLPAVGADLAGKIEQCARTGHIDLLDELRTQIPAFVVHLLAIPQIGPRRAMVLWRKLGIRSEEQLHRAARDGRLAGVKGLGPALERAILAAALLPRDEALRRPIRDVAAIAARLCQELRRTEGVVAVEVAGSFRRGRETVGDLDIVAAAHEPGSIVARFCGLADVSRTLASGKTRATVVLSDGLHVDLRVVEPAAYGSALQYFTGSKAHSIVLRRMAQKAELKLNEYGLFRGKTRIAGVTEESVYAALGLPLIPPELRENRGEIDAALAGSLPSLVSLSDVRGDLHLRGSLKGNEPLILLGAAVRRGFRYMGLVLRSSEIISMSADEVVSAVRGLRRRVEEQSGPRVLLAVEVDLAVDGSPVLSDDRLALFDFVIACPLSQFDLPRDRQTARLMGAMRHPVVSLLAQPCRAWSPRDAPYDVDMARVIPAAAEAGIALEISADPLRLDTGDINARLAKEWRVPVLVTSEAARPEELDDMRFAVQQARRGWLEVGDVLNTGALSSVLRTLGHRKCPSSGRWRTGRRS